MVNTTQYLLLPTFSDPDGHAVTLTHTTLPSYVTYDSVNKNFTFSPITKADFDSG
jgi:hypothetical protein